MAGRSFLPGTALGTSGHVLLQAARQWPDSPGFIEGARVASHAEVAQEALAQARGLIGLGVGKGDHVGILMPNGWRAMILQSACSLIGAVAVMMNARYRGDELRHAVAQAGVRFLFSSADGRAVLDLRALLLDTFDGLSDWTGEAPLRLSQAPALRALYHLGAGGEGDWPGDDALRDAATQCSDSQLAQAVASVQPGDPALILLSSGTTAQPKACVLPHATLQSVAGALAQRLGLVASDVFWNPLPFYHLASHLPMSACRQVGAAYLCQPHFDAGAALAEMEARRATICYPAFPTLTAGLINHPDFAARDLSRLRLMLNIGAPDLLRKFADALPQASQIACFGLTEGGGICTLSDPAETLEQRVTRAGRPLGSHQVRISNPETDAPLATGETGEIQIRGAVFSEYFGDPEQTRRVFTADGWLRSGDLGRFDEDGLLIYEGRLKDMLKVGGENVAALEIEGLIARHPAVKMVQVIGVPDAHLGEVAAAFVELRPGTAGSVTADELIRGCLGQIASYKVPRYLRFVEDWPMGATKIQKFKLAEGFKPECKFDLAALARGEAMTAESGTTP